VTLKPPTATQRDAALCDDKHGFGSRHAASLVELLAPQPGEHIPDLGCGTGHLTAQIARTGASVVALEYSQEIIDQARRRSQPQRWRRSVTVVAASH